jgi:hypothetical protein
MKNARDQRAFFCTRRVGQAKRTHAVVIEVAPAAWVRFA